MWNNGDRCAQLSGAAENDFGGETGAKIALDGERDTGDGFQNGEATPSIT